MDSQHWRGKWQRSFLELLGGTNMQIQTSTGHSRQGLDMWIHSQLHGDEETCQEEGSCWEAREVVTSEKTAWPIEGWTQKPGVTDKNIGKEDIMSTTMEEKKWSSKIKTPQTVQLILNKWQERINRGSWKVNFRYQKP